MAGTTFVAVTAFVLAFDGSRGAAADAGIAQAGWYPWCIEGVIVCASLCTLVLDRRWPWFILLAFTAVSVAANVLHAWEQPGWMWWSLAFAAVPPLALPICVHLVLMVIGRPRGLVAAGSVDASSREEVTDAGGSGDFVPVRNPDPSAPDSLPALAASDGDKPKAPSWEEYMREQKERWAREDAGLVPGIPPARTVANGNGHGKTKVAKAVATVAAYRESNGGRLPSRPELALLAGVSESTARDALALTRKD
jgi:hypothetical protein